MFEKQRLEQSGPTGDCDQAVTLLRSRCDIVPDTAIILGSGLGGLADQISCSAVIPFGDVPGLAQSTAAGHRGEWILGTLFDRPVIAMAGRLHRYEGWSDDEVVFPVLVMAALGATRLIVSNAAGGVNPKLQVGDIVILRDHIHWMGGVFRSPALQSLTSGSQQPPRRRAEVYDREMSTAAMNAAVAGRFNAYHGTYLATLGPNYETRSEYRMMRKIGVDVVGMSTVPEVLAGAALGMRILGISMVSNVANPDQAIRANHTEVLEAGRAAEGKMEQVIRSVLLCS